MNKENNIINLSNLEIIKVSYNDPFFRMTGKHWEFISNAPWRLIKDHHLITGDIDLQITILEKHLVHAQIVSFEEINKFCSGGLIIHLSNGEMIEFFKDRLKTEWQLNLKGQILKGTNHDR